MSRTADRDEEVLDTEEGERSEIHYDEIEKLQEFGSGRATCVGRRRRSEGGRRTKGRRSTAGSLESPLCSILCSRLCALFSINATDIKKLKDHGIHTVAGVLMHTKKVERTTHTQGRRVVTSLSPPVPSGPHLRSSTFVSVALLSN